MEVVYKQQCTYKRKFEARSPNHFFRGKAISITLLSVSYLSGNAPAPYYIVKCGLSDFTIIFHFIS